MTRTHFATRESLVRYLISIGYVQAPDGRTLHKGVDDVVKVAGDDDRGWSASVVVTVMTG